MKIIPGKYPECHEWQNWIAFTKGPEISLVFLYRLAAYVRDVVKAKVTMYGFRTYAEQVAAYNNYLAGGNLAAKPGTSWHEYGLAVDFNRVRTLDGRGVYPGTLNHDYDLWAAGRVESINKYGITHTVKGEPWHIQPIETRGYGGAKSDFADFDDVMNGGDDMKRGDKGDSVKFWQTALNAAIDVGLKVDGDFGALSEAATKTFQSRNGLAASGVVGDATFAKMLDVLMRVDKATIDAAKLKIAQYTADLNNAKTALLVSENKRKAGISALQ